mgnify:CR=1 FL=1
MNMRTNAGYTITESIHIGNTEFVLGESSTDPAQFVTWACKDGDNYFWGHYMTDKLAALRDLLDRAGEELSLLEMRQTQKQEQYGGILTNRSSLAEYCRKYPESVISGDYRSFGFRADTEQYSYMLRVNPHKGEYNLYCYCYRRDRLDDHMKRAEKGIRFITPDYKEKFRIPDGDKIRITTKSGETRERVARYIDDYHMELSGGYSNSLYHICEFAEQLEEHKCQGVIPLRSSLPEQCYGTLLDTGKIVIYKRGETGYYKTDIPYTTKEDARALVDEHNARGGVSKAQEAAMAAGSMFGFDVPAADPANYDENGQPIKPKHRDRGDAR